jgi:hypothetical protein
MFMKKEQGFSVIEGLLFLVITAVIGFTGWFIHNAQRKTDNNFSESVKSSTLRAKPVAKPVAQAQQDETRLPDKAVTVTPTAAEREKIQLAANVYLHRDSSSKFSPPQEKTLVSEDRNFAIQWFCASVEGGCDQLLLKKIDATWVALKIDQLGVGSDRVDANKQYGWPLDFF